MKIKNEEDKWVEEVSSGILYYANEHSLFFCPNSYQFPDNQSVSRFVIEHQFQPEYLGLKSPYLSHVSILLNLSLTMKAEELVASPEDLHILDVRGNVFFKSKLDRKKYYRLMRSKSNPSYLV